MFQCFGLLSVVVGIENKRRKQNQTHPHSIKKGRSWLFVLLDEAVCCSQEPCAGLRASGDTGYGLQRWTKRGYKHTSRI